jgi:hypothetical protein
MLTHRALFAALALVALGCAHDPELTGTYAGTGRTPLPGELGLPEGAMLDVDATITFDGATEGNFDLALGLAYVVDESSSLTDTIDLDGTFVAANGELTLEIAGIEPGEGGAVIETDGTTRCVQLAGFGGTPVCFAREQSNAYSLDGAVLAITLEHVIATTPGSTSLALSRQP